MKHVLLTRAPWKVNDFSSQNYSSWQKRNLEWASTTCEWRQPVVSSFPRLQDAQGGFFSLLGASCDRKCIHFHIVDATGLRRASTWKKRRYRSMKSMSAGTISDLYHNLKEKEMSLKHEDNLRHLPRFPDFFVTFRILSPAKKSVMESTHLPLVSYTRPSFPDTCLHSSSSHLSFVGCRRRRVKTVWQDVIFFSYFPY